VVATVPPTTCLRTKTSQLCIQSSKLRQQGGRQDLAIDVPDLDFLLGQLLVPLSLMLCDLSRDSGGCSSPCRWQEISIADP
jgi:hypothetical protein